MTSSSWWRTQSVFAHMVDEIRVARAALVAPPQRLLLRRRSPRHSPKNYWADFLTQYQSETIGGSRAHLLSGADEVLARLVHERVTPSFSPLRLGEIVAHRQFTVSGVLTKDGQFDRAPKRIPEPQKLQTFFDFLESVKLALLFAQRGPELHLNDWVGWCSNLVRDHPTMYPHVRELYVRSSWSLCMKTRRGPRSRWRGGLQRGHRQYERVRGPRQVPSARLQGQGRQSR